MKPRHNPSDYLVTVDDWRVGRHAQWEVAVHIAADNFFKNNPQGWTLDQRQRFVDNFFRSHTWEDSNLVVQCPVCEQTIANAVLDGANPWEIPAIVKADLATLRARIRAKEMKLAGKRIKP